jgi:hypothetical protein
VLPPVGRPAGVGHLGEVAAVGAVAELALQEVEPGLGGGQGRVLFNPGLGQRAEEPRLPGLQGDELLAGRGELAVSEGFEVSPVGGVDTGGQVEVDDARLEQAAASLGLRPQRGRRRAGRLGGGQRRHDCDGDGGCE